MWTNKSKLRECCSDPRERQWRLDQNRDHGDGLEKQLVRRRAIGCRGWGKGRNHRWRPGFWEHRRAKVLCSGGNNQEYRLGRVRFVMYLNFLGTSQVCVKLECAASTLGWRVHLIPGRSPSSEPQVKWDLFWGLRGISRSQGQELQAGLPGTPSQGSQPFCLCIFDELLRPRRVWLWSVCLFLFVLCICLCVSLSLSLWLCGCVYECILSSCLHLHDISLLLLSLCVQEYLCASLRPCLSLAAPSLTTSFDRLLSFSLCFVCKWLHCPYPPLHHFPIHRLTTDSEFQFHILGGKDLISPAWRGC